MKTSKTLTSLGLLAVAGVFCVSPLAHAVDPAATVKLTVEADQTIEWDDDPTGSGSLGNVETTIKPGNVTNVSYAHQITISNSNNSEYGYSLKAYGDGSGTNKNALYHGTESIPAVSGSGKSISNAASAWGVQATFTNTGTLGNTWTGVGTSSSSPVALTAELGKGTDKNTCYISYGFAAASGVKSGAYEGKVVYSIVPNVN